MKRFNVVAGIGTDIMPLKKVNKLFSTFKITLMGSCIILFSKL